MAERAEALVRIAQENGPCSVRHLFYAATVAKVPGITKDDAGYNKVQRQVLALRRSGSIDYRLVVDSTRWMRKPTSYDSASDALEATARLYRRNLWTQSSVRVEVWAESDSIASTIYDVTAEWDVPLMVTRGQSSETFAYAAAEAWRRDDRQPVVFYVGDHDPAGLDIEDALAAKLTGFYGEDGWPIEWRRIGVTWSQVEMLDLPGTAPKLARRRREYPYPLAVEAEALPAPMLRTMLNGAIAGYVDEHQLDVLRSVEAAERETLLALAGEVAS